MIYLLVGATTTTSQATLAKGFGRLAFSAIAGLDRIVGRNPGSSDGASVVYFVGTNEKVPCITPRELVQSYRGAIR